ncbi:MAG: hypothetical protein MZU84_03210 [Sphingobacterium sp.]|nr:hypothetical protein [Sphingobacterium sp.]
MSKGTKLYIGDTLPGTFDQAGYEAVSWTEVGMVESYSEFGIDHNIGSFTPIGTGVACKYKGAADYGEISMTIAMTTEDSGLNELLAHAENPNDKLPFKLALSNTGVTKPTCYYFPGLTKSAKTNIGGPDELVRANVTIVPVQKLLRTDPA